MIVLISRINGNGQIQMWKMFRWENYGNIVRPDAMENEYNSEIVIQTRH